jgi:hypothetical protein
VLATDEDGESRPAASRRLLSHGSGTLGRRRRMCRFRVNSIAHLFAPSHPPYRRGAWLAIERRRPLARRKSRAMNRRSMVRVIRNACKQASSETPPPRGGRRIPNDYPSTQTHQPAAPTKKTCKCRPSAKRLKGFEPSTFCMASRTCGVDFTRMCLQRGGSEAPRA